jgi:hypothetical protein
MTGFYTLINVQSKYRVLFNDFSSEVMEALRDYLGDENLRGSNTQQSLLQIEDVREDDIDNCIKQSYIIKSTSKNEAEDDPDFIEPRLSNESPLTLPTDVTKVRIIPSDKRTSLYAPDHRDVITHLVLGHSETGKKEKDRSNEK